MHLDEKTIRQVARVAHLRLTADEVEQFRKDGQEILSAFTKISEVKTDHVGPSFHPIKIKDALREDVVGECLSAKDALSLTQNKKDEYFKGPKAIQ
ncbi:Asp-tRNA(Asn)/Glu-tRNA(Gln) amidotransferase subunit GatC [Candidatus Woesearchaeota archaeon]|nr:Asp-tRNA(Asn)/Glu-tRNA(Gln) amidotransferase subunit GatC [Candidatus Woesearchaeota archaeon]